MKKQEFFDAMDKLMEDTSPIHVAETLETVTKEYLPEYVDYRLSTIRYCPMCFKYSNKEDFLPTERKEVARFIFDKDEKIFVKNVSIRSRCPRCGYWINETMTIPGDAGKDDMIVFCETCKKEHKLRDCKEEKSYIDDSGYTYYANIYYRCPVCGKTVKDVSA